MAALARLSWLCTLLWVLLCSGCGGPATTLIVFSGSENKALEEIIGQFEREQGVHVDMRYMGSLDIARALRSGTAIEADAVWPANRMWLDQGDVRHVVKYAASIMRSPVVLALQRPVADRLGWTGRKDLTLRDILAAATSGKFRFATTSATQSNSGASFYLAALTALGAHPGESLTDADLDDPAMRADVKRLLHSADRSSGSSGWLKDFYLANTAGLDGMVNYEGLVWEANRVLEAAGKPTLCPVYPTDAIAIADHPLGYVDKGVATKEAAFHKLQDYLLSATAQKSIQALGRRTGAIGMQGDPAVLTASECFDTARVISPAPLPAAPVVAKALALYQTALRKPSATAYVLDFSGSMLGEREASLKAAMALVLDQAQAAPILLQASPDDVHIVIPFDSGMRPVWTAEGDGPVALGALLHLVDNLEAGGGTDIYSPVAAAMERLSRLPHLDAYFPAVILLTDGQSNEGPGPDAVSAEQRALAARGITIPVFALGLGEADFGQLEALTQSASGRVFDSRTDLIKAFRDAKGYN